MTALQAPIDIQAKLDDMLAGSPEAQKYLSKVWYVPAGTVAPVEVTHLLQLSSALSTARVLTIGLVVKPPYAAMVDALLALAATQ